MHRPEKAGPAIEIAKKYGMLHGVSADPSIASMNWAGKVDWHVSCPESTPCPWLHQGMVMVTSDGFVTQCCLDGDGLGVMGHISEDLDAMIVRPYTLCDKCHHTVPAGAACKVTAGSEL